MVKVEDGADVQLKQSIITIGGSARSGSTSAEGAAAAAVAVPGLVEGVIRPSSDSEYKEKERAGGEWELSGEELQAQAENEKEADKDKDPATLVVGNTRVLVGRNAKVQHTYIQEVALSTRHVEVISSEVHRESR
jgi:hypothetical protein